jgi:hypothetical protein
MKEDTMAADEVQRLFERLVTDEEFRQHVQEDPEYLGSGFDLSPGEAGLLTAVTEAAYGLSSDLVHFQHRMCAVAAD